MLLGMDEHAFEPRTAGIPDGFVYQRAPEAASSEGFEHGKAFELRERRPVLPDDMPPSSGDCLIFEPAQEVPA